MGKKRRRKANAAKRGAHLAAAPAELPEGSSTNPAEQRYYDMPYSAPAPRMINPDLGLHHLVARVGHNAGYEIAVTLLDAPDHRLIRSGVLLAHRVLDGRGEWYITAPDWQPLLPIDRRRVDGPCRSSRGPGGHDPAAAPAGNAGPGCCADLRSA